MEELERWLLNPVPRGATYRKWDDFYLSPRILYAHQLFYVFNGHGNGTVNGESFPLEPGILVVYGPGDTHEFSSINQGGIEMGMICFSLNETSREKRALGNRYVTAIDETYWSKADQKVRVAGLPAFPFRMKLSNLPWKYDFENSLREVGDAWRKQFTEPLIYKAKSVLTELFFRLEQESVKTTGPKTPGIIRQIHEYVANNFQYNLSRKDVASRFHISESYLTTLLMRHSNTNFTAILEEARLRAAMELLQYSDFSIKQIAVETGFNSLSYFVTRFRKKYGITPGSMR